MNDKEARHELCNALALIIQNTELYLGRGSVQGHFCDFRREVQSIHDRAKHDYKRCVDRASLQQSDAPCAHQRLTFVDDDGTEYCVDCATKLSASAKPATPAQPEEGK